MILPWQYLVVMKKKPTYRSVSAIEAQRALFDVSIGTLCVAAGIAPSTYWRWREKGRDPRPQFLRGLNEAAAQLGLIDRI